MNVRSWLGIGLAGLAVWSGGCCDDCRFPLESNGAAQEVDVFEEEDLNRLFTRSGGGWTGGEGAASVPLPGGRVAWLFGNTYLDTVYTDRSRPPDAHAIYNSLVVQERDSLITYHSGTQENPLPFANIGVDGYANYPLSGIVRGNELQIIFAMYEIEEGSIFYRDLVAIDVIRYDLEQFARIDAIRILEYPDILYGSALLEHEDFIYIYGADPRTHYAHVARVPNESLADPWMYYTVDGWSPEMEESRPLVRDVCDQYSVFRRGSDFYMLQQDSEFSKQIWLLTAQDPTGPWSSVKVLYHTLETKGNIITYNAMAHRHLAGEDLTVSYTVASLDTTDVLRNADTFRPVFVTIKNWN